MRRFSSTAELQQAVGEELGCSPWLVVDQAMIDQFAQATGDRQWIHCEPEQARQRSPYGTTVAHGFLTLALLPRLLASAFELSGARMLVNYGLNRVRFPAPVPSGSRVRLRCRLAEVRPHSDEAVTLVLDCTVEVQDQPKIACAAQWLVRVFWTRAESSPSA